MDEMDMDMDMDKLGVPRKKIARTRPEQREKRDTPVMKRQVQQPIKVIHFSNHVQITTTPSDFKARVQELTGRGSDVSAMFDGLDPDAKGPEASVTTASSVLCQEISTGSSLDGADRGEVSQFFLEGSGGCSFTCEDIEVVLDWLQCLDELESGLDTSISVGPSDKSGINEEPYI